MTKYLFFIGKPHAGSNVVSFALHNLMKDCKFVNDSGFQI